MASLFLRRGTLKTSRRGPSLSDTEAQRFDIELVLQAMEHFVADRAVITQPDQGRPVSRQRLMPQPPEGLGGFHRTLLIHGAGSRVALEPPAIMDAQSFSVVRHQPVFTRQPIQPGQGRGGGMLPRLHFFPFESTVFFKTQGPDERREREALQDQRRENDREADQDDFGSKWERRAGGR